MSRADHEREMEADLRELARVWANPRSFHGRRYFRCPRCSDLRKKKRDKVLSVLSEGDGFRFKCHHCGWSGGHFYDYRQDFGRPTQAVGRARETPGGGKENQRRNDRKVRNLYG